MNLFNLIFAKPDPLRFASEAVPVGWNPPPVAKERKRSGNGVYVLDSETNTFGFADKPFETAMQNQPADLTDADVQALLRRNLDPYNPGYAAAKRMFSVNPGVTKKELYEAIPLVGKETFKDVLAAFREAARE